MLMSDRHPTNLVINDYAKRHKPKNTLVLAHWCNLHALHSCTEPCWRDLGFINEMFCTTHILQSGTTYVDLLGHARKLIYQLTEVKYDERPSIDDYNESVDILELTFLRADKGDDSNPSEAWEKAKFLLKMANGKWSKSIKNKGLVHYCRLGCCTSRKQSKEKMWIAVSAVLFPSTPQCPAISRWTKCAGPTRFFALSMLFHGLFQAAWDSMYGKLECNKENEYPLPALQNGTAQNLELQCMVPDEKHVYMKTMRVRSTKAMKHESGLFSFQHPYSKPKRSDYQHDRTNKTKTYNNSYVCMFYSATTCEFARPRRWCTSHALLGPWWCV